MDLLNNSEYFNGFFFFPSFSPSSWKSRWLERVDYEVNRIIIPDINRYIEFKESPRLVFLARGFGKDIRAQLKLERWVRAFTYRSEVYIFFNHWSFRWKSLLRHELFHAGLNQMCSYRQIVPDWFNEAIAYHLSEKSRLGCHRVKYLNRNLSLIGEHFINDSFFHSQLYFKFALIKSFGDYFTAIFGASGVKELIRIASERDDFYRALKESCAMDIPELVESWGAWAKGSLR